MEKKIVPALINFKSSGIGATFTSHFKNKRKTRIAWVFLIFLSLGIPSILAEEPVIKENYGKQWLSLEKRGFVNMVTSFGEFGNAYTLEKKEHSKIWPVTYFPRLLMNFTTRLSSGVNDAFVLPWYAWASHDTTPLTRRFDFPDYVWQKE